MRSKKKKVTVFPSTGLAATSLSLMWIRVRETPRNFKARWDKNFLFYIFFLFLFLSQQQREKLTKSFAAAFPRSHERERERQMRDLHIATGNLIILFNDLVSFFLFCVFCFEGISLFCFANGNKLILIIVYIRLRARREIIYFFYII